MRKPCCDKLDINKGAWSKQEDQKLIDYIKKNGEGGWRTLPQAADLLRCGKSCRLRWINYLRPDLKRGNFGEDEEDLIIKLHALLGNRWSLIAGRLPGRTDNEVKNYWNSHLRRKLMNLGIDPSNHKIIRHSSLGNPCLSTSHAPAATTTPSSLNKQSNNGHMTKGQSQHIPYWSGKIKPDVTNGNVIVSNVDDDGQAISDAASSLEEDPCSSSVPDLNLDLMISSTPASLHGHKSNHTTTTTTTRNDDIGDKTLILFML